ncbi:MAG: hypothetical protein ABI543_09830, partial [Ignavibacteria bacterium]
LFLISAVTVLSFQFGGCSTDEIINAVTKTEVTAKDRLDSANAQAVRDHGASTKLVLIMGQNVKSNGKTELSLLTAVTDPGSIGAWLYVYKNPGDTSLRIYTPNPVPLTSDCIELTALFNTNQLLGLIQDTSARNILSGALSLIISSDVAITTTPAVLLNSDASMNLSYSTSPVIKFNDNFVPSSSTLNGSAFFSTGTNQTRNMILMPAAGTLNLPSFITDLTGFPADLWVVQYKKTNSVNLTESLILGTVVQSGQLMGIPNLSLQSPVINLSKYVTQ